MGAIAALRAVVLVVGFASCATAAGREGTIDVPEVDGKWWRIAPNAPDVGKWSTGKENACDFTIFQSADGAWHCISCIRGTSHFGQRLFFRWEARRITDSDWEPKGTFEVPRSLRPGSSNAAEMSSVQAPHAFPYGDGYLLFYNTGGDARCLIAKDGRAWRPHVNVAGSETFFRMGRDVCLFHDVARGRWIAYYTGTATVGGERRGAMVARTAPKPEGPWSEDETPVRTSGNPESPFVLRRGEHYYLFQQMSVYRSTDPLGFDGAELVNHLTRLWYNGKFAPEVVEHDGDWYVAGYSRGIHVAKLRWVQKAPAEVARLRVEWLATLKEELAKRDERRRRELEKQRNGRE